jgi:hypothetical protein
MVMSFQRPIESMETEPAPPVAVEPGDAEGAELIDTDSAPDSREASSRLVRIRACDSRSRSSVERSV